MSFISVAEMSRRIAQVDIEQMVPDSIQETEKEFLEKQTQQLYEGYLNTGEPIEPTYAESTVKRKKKKGQPYDRVTFKDTGDFYDEMSIEAGNDKIDITSIVPYEKYITQRSGNKIYGLDTDNRKEYIWQSLFPKIKAKMEAVTKLLFR